MFEVKAFTYTDTFEEGTVKFECNGNVKEFDWYVNKYNEVRLRLTDEERIIVSEDDRTLIENEIECLLLDVIEETESYCEEY